MELPIITGNCVRLNDNGHPGRFIHLKKKNPDIGLFEPHDSHVIAHIIEQLWFVTQEGVVFCDKMGDFNRNILTTPPIPLESPVVEVMCKTPFIARLANGKVAHITEGGIRLIDFPYHQVFWFDYANYDTEESRLLAVKYGKNDETIIHLLNGGDLDIYPIAIRNLNHPSILRASFGDIVSVNENGQARLVCGDDVIDFDIDDFLRPMCQVFYIGRSMSILLASCTKLFVVRLDGPVSNSHYTVYPVAIRVAAMHDRHIVSTAGILYRIDYRRLDPKLGQLPDNWLTPGTPESPFVLVRDDIWPGYGQQRSKSAISC